jgi:pimeloyl-ACP methyl ester carboxylesterase
MKALLIESCNAYLAYQDFPGDEPVRVYIHGLGSSSIADFPGIIVSSALGRRRSILVDLLGHGFSEHPTAFDYSLASHAQTVAALLDSLGLTGCEIIGTSLGGSVAIFLASLRPDLVSRLVVEEANLDPGPLEGSNATASGSIAAESEEEYVRTGFARRLAMLRAVMPNYTARLQHADPRALHRSCVSLVSDNRPTLRERLLALPMPRAYIFGELTIRDNAGMAKRADELPGQGVQIFIVPGVGHDMGIVAGDTSAFAEILQQALTS